MPPKKKAKNAEDTALLDPSKNTEKAPTQSAPVPKK